MSPPPSVQPPILLFLLIATSSLPFLAVSQFSTADRTALLTLKRAWRNPPSLQSWNATSSPCDWPEIRCSAGTTGSVTGLFLRAYGIDVAIPSSISDLQNLTALDLAYNLIPDDFPPAILNCTKLQELDLSQNLLVGTIPSQIDRLKSLRSLDVSSNKFTGDVPPTIGNLTQLKHLQLHSNLFNQTYPKEISNLAKLENLSLAYNTFSPPMSLLCSATGVVVVDAAVIWLEGLGFSGRWGSLALRRRRLGFVGVGSRSLVLGQRRRMEGKTKRTPTAGGGKGGRRQVEKKGE